MKGARTDLLALTPEVVTSLANLGLVKRALKEIEQGKGPTFEEKADGTVVGRFEDGVVTELAPGRALKDTRCSCPAPGMCRHRVAAALGYRGWVEGAAPTSTAPAPPPFEPWSPGTFDDATLARALTRGALEQARAERRRGLVVEVTRGHREQPIPSAKLPASSVRFLVKGELAYARCDCREGQGCAHVALAVWAFRAADALDPARTALTVELEGEGRDRTSDTGPLDELVSLVHELAETGVEGAREAMAQRFALTGEQLARAGLTWLATGLEDLAFMLDRYRARSSRYHPDALLALATELVARARVGTSPKAGELPARYVLGRGEAMETPLDHLRLVSLGARLDSDGRERFAEVFLADPDTGAVMVLTKSWSFREGEPLPEGHELGRRRIAGTGTLAQLAAGQLVTRVAKRRANGALLLGTSTTQLSSVTPQTGDFSTLPRPLRVDTLRELGPVLAARPPRMLRPRVLTESLHAVRVSEVRWHGFDAAQQCTLAELADPEGAPLLVRAPFRGASPHAADVLARALSGAMGPIRWVAGSLEHDGHALRIEPTLLVADRVVVPAVEERGEAASAAPIVAPVPLPSATLTRLEAARSLLEEAVQLGVTGTPASHDARLARAVKELDEIGARGLGQRLARYAEARQRRRAGEPVSVAAPLFDAAIRLALAREASLPPVATSMGDDA